ncbi:nuclear transport factor 2 family protein [Saccharothrix sp.]|uniref:nuclear transport factor 2 family protein n=1 Tax=Saccharothrix sp. TaxID=1873460 RepID=UPI002810B8F3|nr:nuclear transport factor 2 family protein [Saccharothrix sp.]
MRTYQRLTAAALLALATACGTSTPPSTRATSTQAPASTGAPRSENLSEADRAAAPQVAQRFVDAANAGDSAAVAATFAEDARFDSVGRIYPSRRDIMDRFLDPEVIDAGGRYEVTGTRWNGDRYRVDYTFTTRSGAREVFYYEFLVRDGLIRDVIGRYS